MNFSTVSDRWSTCAGPEIHFSFSFFHSFLTLIHTSLSRRFWLFLSSSCILPHARFMTVWRLIQTLTGHLTFWEEEVGRRQVHSCCTLHILHWRVRGTFNNSFYFHKGLLIYFWSQVGRVWRPVRTWIGLQLQFLRSCSSWTYSWQIIVSKHKGNTKYQRAGRPEPELFFIARNTHPAQRVLWQSETGSSKK